MALRGQSVLVMGMGRSGVSAAQYAVSQGAHVRATDLNADAPQIPGAKHTYGKHIESEFTTADLIIVSPGIPASAPHLDLARKAGVRVVSELGFAAEIIQQRGIPIIAVTGTNGKSSVTWFIGQLLEAAGYSVFVGGNIGRALTELLASDEKPDFAVVEVSSYQLELPGGLQPTAAAVLNLAPDHLGRHGTMGNYAKTKTSLFQNMNANAFAALPKSTTSNPEGLLQHGDTQARTIWLDGEPGVDRNGDQLEFRGTPDDGLLSIKSLSLLGEHNRDNAGAAALLCVCAGVPRKKLDFSVLRPLPHRLQPVHEAHGVTWVNDSKATNVDAAMVGIMGIDRPTIILLGGAGKPGADYSRLQSAIDHSARSVICFGHAGSEILAAIRAPQKEQVSSLSDAVQRAANIANKLDVVLLSPACASFDEFNNFEERGEAFTTLAQEATL